MTTQSPHSLTLIPGPIEFSDEVLHAMAHPSQSHVAPAFIEVFGEVLTLLRKFFVSSSESAQPFVLAGSGTLGWDSVAANLTEPGEEVLVLHSGYFADSFAECFETYGVKPTQLKAPIGSRPTLEQVEHALKEKKYKAITITHVDTSTGVLSDVKAIAELVKRVSPDTLIIVDGVCSVGSEQIYFDEWNLDLVLTASQKAIGVPPGLCIMFASGRAVKTLEERKSLPGSYYASWKKWIPILRNYEAKKPSYFATPPVQLIHALHTSLKQILSAPIEKRFESHHAASLKVKKAIADLGLKQLASDPSCQANGMTAVYLPEGVTLPDLLPRLAKKGIIFAGGLHREIATKYFRIGHMGISATDPGRGDLDRAIQALREALEDAGYKARL